MQIYIYIHNIIQKLIYIYYNIFYIHVICLDRYRRWWAPFLVVTVQRTWKRFIAWIQLVAILQVMKSSSKVYSLKLAVSSFSSHIYIYIHLCVYVCLCPDEEFKRSLGYRGDPRRLVKKCISHASHANVWWNIDRWSSPPRWSTCTVDIW